MKENNKEIKERRLKARTLSDEELAMVAGGKENPSKNGIYSIYCNKYITLDAGGRCSNFDNCNNVSCSYRDDGENPVDDCK